MADSNRSQTLDRGLKALSFIAKCNTAPTIDELAENLGLGRTVTYRIVRTLEDHNLVSRAEDGRLRPGSHLATLARQIRGDLQSAAHGVMTRLSNELGMTSFLVVSELKLETLRRACGRASIPMRSRARDATFTRCPHAFLDTDLLPGRQSVRVF